MTSFEVKNQGIESAIAFQKKGTTVNGKEYAFASPTEVYNTGTLTVKTKLMNTGPGKIASVEMSVYEWSDLAGSPVEGRTVEKTLNIAENGAEDIVYDISNLPSGTYEVRLSAWSGDEKSIMKLRLPITGVKGRFIYMGLDSFPLKKGSSASAFTCFSQSADYGTPFNGTIKLEVLDEQGNPIMQDQSETFEIKATPPQARMTSFNPGSDYNVVTLKATMYDSDGNVQDTYSLNYDYSKYRSAEGKLLIDIDKKNYQPGDELTYTVSYTGKNGAPLRGKMIAYLTDNNGRIIATAPDIAINGQYRGSFKLPEKDGTYTITARETEKDLKTEASATTGVEAQTTTTLPEETNEPSSTLPAPEEKTEQPNNSTAIIIVIVVLLVIIAAVMLRRKNNENKKQDSSSCNVAGPRMPFSIRRTHRTDPEFTGCICGDGKCCRRAGISQEHAGSR